MAQTSNAIEVSSIGCKILWAPEASAGVRPTAGFQLIPNITSAPAFEMTPEALDSSDLGDDITQYIAGRRDPGGDAAFTANLTADFLDAWEGTNGVLPTAQSLADEGKRIWFEYQTPNFAKSYFWSGMPVALGHGGLEQNSVQTIQAHVVPNGDQVWAAKSS